ncbi:MAG: PDZ domain-containing protein [Verrucomicrobiota bacterium]
MLIVTGVALAITVVLLRPARQSASPAPAPPDLVSSARPVSPDSLPAPAMGEPVAAVEDEPAVAPEPAAQPALATNKLERLASIRARFHALAAGDPIVALRAAKQLTDDTERETALLTLATEWTHGELGPSRKRSQAIALYGLEVGWGLELIKNPELAVAWANELTDEKGRAILLQETAGSLVKSDPVSAFALSDRVPEAERRYFYDAVFAEWGRKDTEAALQWSEKLPDPVERTAALEAIRTTAPIGIGTTLAVHDGYPVIQALAPGAPAELSGQIHPGDRILALAQGNSAFVDARDVPLVDIVNMVRGAPGTLLQLQVLPANAPPNSAPRTVSVIRDQVKFKR